MDYIRITRENIDKEHICCAMSGKHPKFLAHKGFALADTSDCGITLMYLPLDPAAAPPQFRECARHPMTQGEGFVLYYTDIIPTSVPSLITGSPGWSRPPENRASPSGRSISPTGKLPRASPRR